MPSETDTASSYYALTKHICAQQAGLQHHKQQSSGEEINNTDNQIWVEDSWTEEEISQVADMLSSEKPALRAKAHQIQKYEAEAALNWDRFYTRNHSNFFKDRHYLQRVFPELSVERLSDTSSSCGPFVLLEVGCGVGNAVLPLLEKNPNLHVWGLDLSHVAIDLMRQDKRFANASRQGRAKAAVWDITAGSCPLICTNMKVEHVEGVADGAIFLFCLSAITPEKMKDAVRNVIDTLKPGGCLLFRDYGRFDEAQLKLGTSRGKCLGDNFYVKQDGTRCYYFDLDDIRAMFSELEEVELSYIRRVYSNRGDQSVRRRVWIHGRFRKPQ
mmetsp:Transcript_15508/g.24100  ORF Transcript_15508/g.24100 Transcript_15508/m.24100 type:complete len:328 (+) Transcript_15508:139-1122(+)